ALAGFVRPGGRSLRASRESVAAPRITATAPAPAPMPAVVPAPAPSWPAAVARPPAGPSRPRVQARARDAREKSPAPNLAENEAESGLALLRAAEEGLRFSRLGEACALGQRAAEKIPGVPAVWEFLGRCYMRLAEPEQARAYYRKYLALAPDEPRASFVRAMVEP